MQERGERTVLQRSDTLKGHAEVVWVQESRWVIEELHVLFVLVDKRNCRHERERRGGLTRIVTIDIVVGATEARRVPFSFSSRVGGQKRLNFSRLLLLAVRHKTWVLQIVWTSTSQEDP